MGAVWVTGAFSCTEPPPAGGELTVTFSAQNTVSTGGSGGSGGSEAHAGGNGGHGGDGGMGGMQASVTTTSTGGAGGMGGSSSSGEGGMGGTGGAPPVETPVNGCLLTNAINLTGVPSPINITYSGGANGTFTTTINGVSVALTFPMCLKINSAQVIKICQNPPTCSTNYGQGGPLFLGGKIALEDGIAAYDNVSPIQPSCFVGGIKRFDPNALNCYTGGTWPCGPTVAACNNDLQKIFSVKTYGFYNNSKQSSQTGALYVVY
jgi:hypothetical protein